VQPNGVTRLKTMRGGKLPAGEEKQGIGRVRGKFRGVRSLNKGGSHLEILKRTEREIPKLGEGTSCGREEKGLGQIL